MQNDLVPAVERVAAVQRRIATQKRLIEELRDLGEPTEGAEALLVLFHDTLRQFEAHLALTVDGRDLEDRRGVKGIAAYRSPTE
jgi:hypothetical protein